MPQRDIYGKGVFKIETQKVTGGALEFEQDPSTPVHSATPDGLFRLRVKKKLKTLPLPWSLCPTDKNKEVLLEIKMQKDHLDAEALSRAFLQRYAREVYRFENEKDFGGNTMLWLVAAHVPGSLGKATEVVEVKKKSGCYRVETKFFPFYWVASNELPLSEELIPFLVTRTGKSLEAFVSWVSKKRPPTWVLLLMENVKMDKAFVEQMTNALANHSMPRCRSSEKPSSPRSLIRIQSSKRRSSNRMVRQEVRRTLMQMLAKKLQKTLSLEETQAFFVQFEQEGSDAISEKLIMSSKNELETWLKAATKTATKKTPTKKATPKKTQAKKPTKTKK